MLIEIHKTGTYDYYEEVEVDIDEVSGLTSMFDVKNKICEMTSEPLFDKQMAYYGGTIIIESPHDEEIVSVDKEYYELIEIIDQNRKEKEFDEKYQLKLDFDFDD